jgi:hypothetical protein
MSRKPHFDASRRWKRSDLQALPRISRLRWPLVPRMLALPPDAEQSKVGPGCAVAAHDTSVRFTPGRRIAQAHRRDRDMRTRPNLYDTDYAAWVDAQARAASCFIGTSAGSTGLILRPTRSGVDSTVGSSSGSTANDVMTDDFLAIDGTPNLGE